MSLFEVVLLAVGLSMDACAVSVGKGLGMRTIDIRYSLVLALAFGVFQALMPVLGWLLASSFADLMRSVDHWVAFGLLVLVGSKMLVDAIRGEDDDSDRPMGATKAAEVLMLAVATSIDAFAIGITFAALGTSLMPAVAIIGVTTFLLSLGGVVLGNRFGSRFERPAGVVGGIILVGIGLKVLLEHLSTGI